MRVVGGFVTSLCALQRRPQRLMATWTTAALESEESRDVASKLKAVQARIAERSGDRDVTLVAVSKTKPLALVTAAAHAGHRDFGENYIQELVEKSTAARDAEDPVAASLRWHFIGKIQSNKAKLLCSAPNLYAVHTIHNEKIASALQRHWHDAKGPDCESLRVFVQVNTSGEEAKGGCEPKEAADLALFVRSQCPNLRLEGLMCIGKYSGSEGDASPDFLSLKDCRMHAANALGVDEDSLALSMGMSHDFETAVDHGATHVRVGSTIFGARVYS